MSDADSSGRRGGNLLKRMMVGIMTSMPGMMSCREADSFMLDYVEGTLPPRKIRRVRRHLRICKACRRYLDAYKKAIEFARMAFADWDMQAEEALPEDLAHAILAAHNGQPGPAD